MDKNMIKIDDLVRQRLTGAEEQERTGAWLNMRDLLDEKMPAKKPLAAFPWKRLMTAVTGVALLASLSVGGYHMYATRMQQAELIKNPNPQNQNMGSDESRNTHMVNRRSDDGLKGETINGNTPSSTVAVLPENIQDKGVSPTKNESKNIVKPNTQNTFHTQTANTNIAGNVIPTASKIEHKHSEDIAHSADAINHSSLATIANNANKNAAQQQQGIASDGVMANAKRDNPFPTSAAEQPRKNHSSAQNKNKPDSKQASFVANSGSNKASVHDNTTAPLPLIKRDTFNSITLRQRMVLNPITRQAKFLMDTINIGKMAFEEVQLLPVKEAPVASAKSQQPAQAINITPNAAMAQSGTSAMLAENRLLVPLSTMKVKTQKTTAWNARSFNEVVRDMQYNLSLVRFYPGIIFGVNNNMFGTNTINGLHIGLTGLFTFGEHWNMMAEFKYVHRINQGTSLQDNYTKITDSAVNGNGQRTYLQSNVEHFFKFSTLQSLEMPIAIRYAINRFNLFAGVNMAYNFAVNAEEVDRAYDSTVVVAGTPGVLLHEGPGVQLKDFGSRFSIGYLLGVGYQLSPSVQLDFRASQNLWDNARGDGGILVSKQLYRLPSMQLSLSYRFNQRARIPKAK